MRLRINASAFQLSATLLGESIFILENEHQRNVLKVPRRGAAKLSLLYLNSNDCYFLIAIDAGLHIYIYRIRNRI